MNHSFRRGALGRSAAAIAGLLVVTALSGCSVAENAVDQGRQAVESAASSALSSAADAAVASVVTDRLKQAGITLDGPPTCTNDMTFNAGAGSGKGVVTCTGTTTGGAAVEATFDGELSASTCAGSLSITVDGEERISVPRVDGCRLGSLIGGVAEGGEQ